MNCTEFNAALEQHIETRNPLDSGASKHLASCSGCRMSWEVQRQLDAAIAAWRPVEVPARLVDRVLGQLADSMSTSDPLLQADQRDSVQPSTVAAAPVRQARSSGRLGVFASAAMCLIVVVAGLARNPGRHPGDSSDVANRETEVQSTESAVDVGTSVELAPSVSQTLTAVMSELRSEYREIANETSSVASDLVNSIPHQIDVPARLDVPTQPKPDVVALGPSSSDVDRIWRPIGSRVETALGFLWQAVPLEIPSG